MTPTKALAFAALLCVYNVSANFYVPTKHHLRGGSMPHTHNDTSGTHRDLVSTRTVLVLRVTASSIGSPTVSKDELYKRIFSDTYSLKNQMERCSAGQVQLNPTIYGVIDITVEGTNKSTPRSEVVAKAKLAALKYVNKSFTDIRQVADHTMIVVPNLQDGFIASAEVALTDQHTMAVYEDHFAASLSVLMHETAHNLGLDHAHWQGNEYGDTTGNMGASASELGGPQYCYNAANHWSLQWFSDSRLDLEPPSTPITVNIPAFVDYKETAAAWNKYVLVKVGTLYMQYNRAKDYNVGTRAMPNQLVIVRQTGLLGTELVTGLDLVNPSYSDGSVSIRVCTVETIGGVDSMIVSIGKSSTNCQVPSSQPPPIPAPTASNPPPQPAPTTPPPRPAPPVSPPPQPTNGWTKWVMVGKPANPVSPPNPQRYQLVAKMELAVVLSPALGNGFGWTLFHPAKILSRDHD